MESIHASVTQDGVWYVAEFVLDGHEYGTQAHSLAELALEVADAAALMTGMTPADFTVTFAN